MALSKFGERDGRLGQGIASGNDTVFVPAVMMVDSAGNEIPAGGTAVAASSGDKANAVATATLPAVAGKTNYITGAEITYSGATTGAVFLATLTGVLGGTQSFVVSVPTGATVGGSPICIKFDPPHPASAANTAIAVSLPALGTGAAHACVNVRGILK